MRELQQDQARLNWAIAAGVICFTGLLLLAVATDRIQLKDAFFSMDPEKICYRTGLLGKVSMLYWANVVNVRVKESVVWFELQNGHRKMLSLSAIPDPNVAHHVATSLRLAAMEKNIAVNGVQMHPDSQVVAS